MPSLFRDVQTGAAHPLDAERTLIGTAPHAELRLPDPGAAAAALVVHYPSEGWVLHPLADDPPVARNGRQVPAGGRAALAADDVVAVGDAAFRFEPDPRDPPTPVPPARTTACHLTIRGPDGLDEHRVIDHDLLIGRLATCHVSFPDPRLSRVSALLAADGGTWYAHNLAARPIGQNRLRVDHSTPLESGDELQIGPLVVRVELRAGEAAPPPPPPAAPVPAPAAPSEATTDDAPGTADGGSPATTDAATADAAPPALRRRAARLDKWLRTQPVEAARDGRQWVEKVKGFWADAREATTARALRTTGRLTDAFSVLDPAVRARPDSPDLLWEVYRLYRAAGLTDLCYRPLRRIEKVAEVRGAKPDPRALETLAQVCEDLGRDDPAMFDRALTYWDKLESATGVSYARERNAASAKRSLLDNDRPARRSSFDA